MDSVAERMTEAEKDTALISFRQDMRSRRGGGKGAATSAAAVGGGAKGVVSHGGASVPAFVQSQRFKPISQ